MDYLDLAYRLPFGRIFDQVGEIIICPQVAKREAKNFDLSIDGYIAYLFIHGLVHLKGHDHGDTMDKLEQKFMRQFAVT